MIKGLAERLHLLRIENSLSQKQVAERLGLSPSIVSGYETGERTPSTEVLLAISNLYHCSTDYLLGKSPADPSKMICVDGLGDQQIRAIKNLIDTFQK